MIGFLTALVMLFLPFGVCAHAGPPALELPPHRDQPLAESLQPGLKIIYFYPFVGRHIDELPTGETAARIGRKGEPIAILNHKFGNQAVFDSRQNRFIGMQISGLIRFGEVGSYAFQAQSNDGIRVRVGDLTVVDDPGVHIDKFSDQVAVEIRTPGWYPLQIQYFQRKKTATIELYWKEPGKSDFAVIPAEAFAHLGS